MNNTTDSNKAKQVLSLTIDRIDGAYAAATIRAYRSNFFNFITYCESINSNALPADPSTISSYIEKLTEDGWRSASIRQTIASIATIHTLNNYANPTMDSEVKLALKRMHRKIGRFSNQANGINKALLDEILVATDNSLRGYRDRALLLIAYDTMCRRSELVNIKLNNISEQKTYTKGNFSSTVIFIEQSKTDQEANGRWLKIGNQATQALHNWLEVSQIMDGCIFRGISRNEKLSNGLTPGQICRIYKRLARAAGFDNDFISHVSGHSIRVGAAQDLLLAGATLPMMMAKGRWSKPDTVMRYVEKVGFSI